MAFSTIAWPEFQLALTRDTDMYGNIEVLRRDLVPFRIPWLEPTESNRKRDQVLFHEKARYYQQVLIPRGLIDIDKHDTWTEHLERFEPHLPDGCTAELICYPAHDDIEKRLDNIEEDPRGYRFWHEVRVVRLRVK
jgi:hypothetical protein